MGAAPAPKPLFVEKKVGGAKNGETRMVRMGKLANDYPTKDPAPKGTSKNFFSKHARKLRASLAPGAIAIVLAGVHKGKRVIVLKQLGAESILGPRSHCYCSCWCSQGQACYCSQAAGNWSPPGDRTPQAQWLPHEKG